MKIAIIGSRTIYIPPQKLAKYIPNTVTQIISGGANGIDTSAREYALLYNLRLVEYLPDYKKYKRGAPIKRNMEIIENSDLVIAFWDGKSRGTKFVIEACKKQNKEIIIHLIERNN